MIFIQGGNICKSESYDIPKGFKKIYEWNKKDINLIDKFKDKLSIIDDDIRCIYAHSFGCWILFQLMIRDDYEIPSSCKDLIIASPAGIYPSEFYESWINPNREDNLLDMNTKCIYPIRDLRSRSALQRYKGNIWIVSGTNDNIIAPIYIKSLTRDLKSIYGDKKVSSIIFKGGDHLPKDIDLSEYKVGSVNIVRYGVMKLPEFHLSFMDKLLPCGENLRFENWIETSNGIIIGVSNEKHTLKDFKVKYITEPVFTDHIDIGINTIDYFQSHKNENVYACNEIEKALNKPDDYEVILYHSRNADVCVITDFVKRYYCKDYIIRLSPKEIEDLYNLISDEDIRESKHKINNVLKDEDAQKSKPKVNESLKDEDAQNSKPKIDNVLKDEDAQNSKPKVNESLKSEDSEDVKHKRDESLKSDLQLLGLDWKPKVDKFLKSKDVYGIPNKCFIWINDDEIECLYVVPKYRRKYLAIDMLDFALSSTLKSLKCKTKIDNKPIQKLLKDFHFEMINVEEDKGFCEWKRDDIRGTLFVTPYLRDDALTIQKYRINDKTVIIIGEAHIAHEISPINWDLLSKSEKNIIALVEDHDLRTKHLRKLTCLQPYFIPYYKNMKDNIYEEYYYESSHDIASNIKYIPYDLRAARFGVKEMMPYVTFTIDTADAQHKRNMFDLCYRHSALELFYKLLGDIKYDELHENVKEFFSNKYSFYDGISFTTALADIPCMNELEKYLNLNNNHDESSIIIDSSTNDGGHVNYKQSYFNERNAVDDVSCIVIYCGAAHVITYNEYIAKYHKPQLAVDKTLIDEMLMNNEIYNYIMHNTPFITPATSKIFTERYPNQNGGILGEDAYNFAKRYNFNLKLIQDETSKTSSDDILLYVLNGSHTIYIHKDEVYDSSQFQQTSNGCTLWAAVIASLRPCVKSYGEMMNIIKHITQEQLQIISAHFFGRDKKWFKYNNAQTLDGGTMNHEPIKPFSVMGCGSTKSFNDVKPLNTMNCGSTKSFNDVKPLNTMNCGSTKSFNDVNLLSVMSCRSIKTFDNANSFNDTNHKSKSADNVKPISVMSCGSTKSFNDVNSFNDTNYKSKSADNVKPISVMSCGSTKTSNDMNHGASNGTNQDFIKIFTGGYLPISMKGGCVLSEKYENAIKNWLGHMSKYNFHIHHLVTLFISNPSKYYEIQNKYRDYSETKPEEIKKFCSEDKSRLERAYIHCKVRGIDPIKEFETLKQFIKSREKTLPFALYRTETTNRFDLIHKGDSFYNASIFTTTPNKDYAMKYLTKYKTAEEKGKSILLIFPENTTRATWGKLDSDSHTTYVTYEDIFSDKIKGTSAESTEQDDEYWINPSGFEIIDESMDKENNIRILTLKQI